jgi:hypothetical protein
VPRILSISRNRSLLARRSDALALAGSTVASPYEPDDSVLLFSQQSFDAVVIGHSVEPEIRKVLIAGIRDRRATIPIVFVYTTPDTGEEPLADLSIDITAGPMSLVRALDSRLRRVRTD